MAMTPMELKLIRVKLGLTQKELSQRLGITQVAISRLEKGDYNISREISEKVNNMVEEYQP